MKINYKNTALNLLDKNITTNDFRILSDGTAHNGPTEEMIRLCESIVRIWPNISPKFRQRIQYLSDPFYYAYEKSAGKMAKVLDEEEIDLGGTFIYRASESETNTVFYYLKTVGKDKNFDMDATVFIFNNSNKTDKPSLAIVCQRRFGFPAGSARFYASKAAEKAGITPTSVIVDMFTLVLFLKYCEIETKIISANKKDRHVGIKYVNETKSNIEVLDSTWFTTIIKSEGFTVGADTGGFFKMQPYGPNNSQRKLIWVLPYEKEGYTRQAKVLNESK